jgi:hypothetical protein
MQPRILPINSFPLSPNDSLEKLIHEQLVARCENVEHSDSSHSDSSHSDSSHSDSSHSSFSQSSFSQSENSICNDDNQFLPLGFPRSAVHEFFLRESFSDNSRGSSDTHKPYLPLAFIIAGIWASFKRTDPSTPRRKINIWIGKNIWPSPYALPDEMRSAAYFLNPTSNEKRNDRTNFDKQTLWAIDAALKSPAVGAIVVYQERVPFVLSQRFALAARTGATIGIIIRPYKALELPSAAPFRWEVAPAPSPNSDRRRWEVTLHKAKHSFLSSDRWLGRNKWVVEYKDETFSMRIPSELVDRGSEELSQRLSADRESAVLKAAS